MRVIYVSTGNVPSRWAHTFQIMKMAEALAGRVADLELLTAGSWWPGVGSRVDLANWYGVEARFRVRRLPVHPFRRDPFFRHFESRRFDLAAAAWCRLKRPDLVYSRSPRAGARCVRMGLPTVIENHTDTGSRFFAPILEVAKDPALRAVVTVSEALRDDYEKAGIPAEKLLCWPDAVDLRRFEALPERGEARRRLSLPVRSPLALYCGHFYPEKGVETVLEAAPLAPAVNFALVGGWPEDLAERSVRARQRHNVMLRPFVPNTEVPLQLAAADVLLLPNSARHPQARTTSPLKLFEYMAARRPVIASRIPALEGLLRHGENAWLVEPDSPRALADAVRELCAKRELADRLAADAALEVARFTWERRATEILEFALGSEAP